MNVDIFIRSYYKDLQWLGYCLRSIEKYTRGFRKTILVVPKSSAERLIRSGLDRCVQTHICEDFADDYLGQQVTKLHADQYSDADFICHVDSDCLFHRPVVPDEFFSEDGKLVIPMTSYRSFPQEIGWQRISERFMCREVEYDFMRRQPFIFPRWIYEEIRDHAILLHNESLYDYVRSQPPRGFAEYNALGAFAYYFHRDEFIWNERHLWAADESICRWFWSWGGISRDSQKEIDAILD
jgi:hypothetical protein